VETVLNWKRKPHVGYTTSSSRLPSCRVKVRSVVVSVARRLRFVRRPRLLHRRLAAPHRVAWIRRRKRAQGTAECKRRRGHHAWCQAVTATKPSACARYVYPIPALFCLICLSTSHPQPSPFLLIRRHSGQVLTSLAVPLSGRRSNWFLMVSRRITLAPKRQQAQQARHS